MTFLIAVVPAVIGAVAVSLLWRRRARLAAAGVAALFAVGAAALARTDDAPGQSVVAFVVAGLLAGGFCEELWRRQAHR
ncbi:hypothetical protein [Motilibacter deserti]|uniref:Secreted protein with PEP-CTERM sorting signal n=1 Tax=Motilibacter deserti TaxID=2714956 RepID=A0ABX0GTX0_9ACTN|nr:hypothetical protein [Motilibacter deserti]NHC14352.1 hypothetical protein [Motilibacter deserti]